MKTNEPEISIITPCFRAAGFLRKNLESVASQRGVRVEHVVVDGGSEDGTREILEKAEGVRWISEKDEGQADAFNKGLRLARGEIIGWLNADDWYEPGALEQVVRYFREHADAAIVNGHLLRVDEAGREIEFHRAQSSRFWLRHFWWKWYGLNHPSTFYQREVFEKVGEVDASLHYAMDYDFYLRAAQMYEFHDIDCLTTRMLVHAEAKTSQGWDNFARDVQRTMKKVWWPGHRVFYWYSLCGIRAHAARCRLVESFLAMRRGEWGEWWGHLRAAWGWFPALFVLPSAYSYVVRVVARLMLGEAGYARLRGERGATTQR